MFFVQTSLPSSLSDSQAEQLSDALALYSDMASTMRDQSSSLPHDDRDWVLRWIVEDDIPLQICQDHMERCADVHGISKAHIQNLSWDTQKIDQTTNWLEESYRAFPPFSVSPFFIYGSHFDTQNGEAIPVGEIGLQIDAATAFGSGEHGTTEGCLRAMIELNDQGIKPSTILDMGTGSGILAIAAAKIWDAPILAVDNDAEAVRVCERHALANDITLGAHAFTAVCGDGFLASEVVAGAPFDLIIANILAGPLMTMAGDLDKALSAGGHVILSGILNEQAERVDSVYSALGLKKAQEISIGEWTSFIFQKA